MTKYTAIFKDGSTLVSTSEKFKSRLAFYNYICENRLGVTRGEVVEIRCTPYID